MEITVATRLLTTYQVAAMLNVSQRTVCLWVECSELPAVKIGRHWRFNPDIIEKLMGKCDLIDSKGLRRCNPPRFSASPRLGFLR